MKGVGGGERERKESDRGTEKRRQFHGMKNPQDKCQLVQVVDFGLAWLECLSIRGAGLMISILDRHLILDCNGLIIGCCAIRLSTTTDVGGGEFLLLLFFFFTRSSL